MAAAAYFELVISATAFLYYSFRSKMLLIEATKSEMIKAPQNALMIEMIRPKGEIAVTSPYPTVVIVITTHHIEVR
jgi:hypothetical protein